MTNISAAENPRECPQNVAPAAASAERTSLKRTRSLQTILLALTLALAPAAAIGFGRFAYALILPSMRADLGWNFQQSGALNTANAVGYLVGAFLTSQTVKRFPLRSVLLVSLAVSVASLFLAGMTRSFPLLLALRALVGVSSAFTFISATGIGARLGKDANENSLAIGLTTAGPGWGTAISGAILPFVLDGHVSRWALAWEILAVIGVLALAIVWAGTRSLPDAPLTQSLNTQSSNTRSSNEAAGDRSETASLLPLLPAMAAYFLFGLGYIAYMTFLVAFVRSLSAGEGGTGQGGAATVAAVYVSLGAAMVGGVFVWRRFLAVDRGGVPLALMGLLGASAAILPCFASSLPVLILSAVAFGIASMPVFTAITLLIRRHLPQSAWTSAIAWATVIFAVGQSLGPLGSGALSDHFGLSASLWWTTIIMTVGAAVALFQKKRRGEAGQ